MNLASIRDATWRTQDNFTGIEPATDARIVTHRLASGFDLGSACRNSRTQTRGRPTPFVDGTGRSHYMSAAVMAVGSTGGRLMSTFAGFVVPSV